MKLKIESKYFDKLKKKLSWKILYISTLVALKMSQEKFI